METTISMPTDRDNPTSSTESALVPFIHVLFEFARAVILRAKNEPEKSFFLASRAGITLYYLIQKIEKNLPSNIHVFGISRIALLKVLYDQSRACAISTCEAMQLHETLEINVIKELQNSESSSQNISFQNYFSQFKPSQTCVLVDSGWRGTCQHILDQICPEVNWEGFYLGYYDLQPYSPKDVEAFLFDERIHSKTSKRRHVQSFNHLYESLLEPEVLSVGSYENNNPYPELIWDENHIRPELTNAKDRLGPIDHKSLFKSVFFPTMQDVNDLQISEKRGTDLGQKTQVSILLHRTEGTIRTRLKRSLWPSGQARIEKHCNRSLQIAIYLKFLCLR